MTAPLLAMLGQCPNEKRYPLCCPYADGSKTSQCEKCFVIMNPEDDTSVKIIEAYMRSVGYLSKSSEETLKFYWRNIQDKTLLLSVSG